MSREEWELHNQATALLRSASEGRTERNDSEEISAEDLAERLKWERCPAEPIAPTPFDCARQVGETDQGWEERRGIWLRSYHQWQEAFAVWERQQYRAGRDVPDASINLGTLNSKTDGETFFVVTLRVADRRVGIALVNVWADHEGAAVRQAIQHVERVTDCAVYSLFDCVEECEAKEVESFENVRREPWMIDGELWGAIKSDVIAPTGEYLFTLVLPLAPFGNVDAQREPLKNVQDSTPAQADPEPLPCPVLPSSVILGERSYTLGWDGWGVRLVPIPRKLNDGLSVVKGAREYGADMPAWDTREGATATGQAELFSSEADERAELLAKAKAKGLKGVNPRWKLSTLRAKVVGG